MYLGSPVRLVPCLGDSPFGRQPGVLVPMSPSPSHPLTLKHGALVAALCLFVGAAHARADETGKALDEYFKGAVVGLKGKVVSLRYDFSAQEQLGDWAEGVPWPIEKVEGQSMQWFDDKLEVKGSTGAHHKADWTGDIWITCTLVTDSDKDLGGYIAPSDGSDNYAAYTLAEHYFHAWDHKAGGMHGILKFGKQWRVSGSPADFIGFRYGPERAPPEP